MHNFAGCHTCVRCESLQYLFAYDGYDIDRGHYAWESVRGRADRQLLAARCCVTAVLTRARWFFAQVVMLRKLSVLMVAVLLQDAYLQTLAAIATVTFFLCLQLSYQPYQSKTFNQLETLALVSLFVTQVISVAYLREGVDNAGVSTQTPVEAFFASEDATTALLIGVNVTTVLVFVGALLRAYFAARLGANLDGKELEAAARVAKSNPFAAAARMAELEANAAADAEAARSSKRLRSRLSVGIKKLATGGSGKRRTGSRRMGSGGRRFDPRNSHAEFASRLGSGRGRGSGRNRWDRFGSGRSAGGSPDKTPSPPVADLTPLNFSENPMFAARSVPRRMVELARRDRPSVRAPPPRVPPPPPPMPGPPPPGPGGHKPRRPQIGTADGSPRASFSPRNRRASSRTPRSSPTAAHTAEPTLATAQLSPAHTQREDKATAAEQATSLVHER